jgi:glycine cleavage system aminomethyltransferase T
MKAINTPKLRSPLHSWHRAHGARMAEIDGWEVAAAYPAIADEHTAGLADISSFAKLAFQGRDVAALARSLVGEGPATSPLGVSRLANRTLACRLTEDSLLLLGSASAVNSPEPLPPHVEPFDQTLMFTGFSIVGQHIEAIMRQLTAVAFLPMSSCVQIRLAGVSVLLVRIDELSVPSIRVYVSWELAEYLWETLLELRCDWGIAPIGLERWQNLLA